MQTITREKYNALKAQGYAAKSDEDGRYFILQRNPETEGTELVPVQIEAKKATRTPNPCAKTRDKANPYEIWETLDGTWQWRVLKKYQTDDNKPFARWLCAVRSPFTYGSFEMGDCYVKDVKTGNRKVNMGGN